MTGFHTREILDIPSLVVLDDPLEIMQRQMVLEISEIRVLPDEQGMYPLLHARPDHTPHGM